MKATSKTLALITLLAPARRHRQSSPPTSVGRATTTSAASSRRHRLRAVASITKRTASMSAPGLPMSATASRSTATSAMAVRSGTLRTTSVTPATSIRATSTTPTRKSTSAAAGDLLGVEVAVGRYDNFDGPTQDYTYYAVSLEKNGFYGKIGGFAQDFDGEYFEGGYGTSVGDVVRCRSVADHLERRSQRHRLHGRDARIHDRKDLRTVNVRRGGGGRPF